MGLNKRACVVGMMAVLHARDEKGGVSTKAVRFALLIVLLSVPVHRVSIRQSSEIDSIDVSPTTIHVGETATLTVNSSDPDDDALTYQWSAEKGSFNNTTEKTVEWTAPDDTGSVTVTIKANDGEDTDSLSRDIDVQEAIEQYVAGTNETTVNIPEDGTYAATPINITGAPDNAILDSVRLLIDITHASPQDLWIQLHRPPDVNQNWVVLYQYDYPAGK